MQLEVHLKKHGECDEVGAPGEFELWVLLRLKTCVPGFVSSFHADPRPLGSHERSALINTGPVDAGRQTERADDA